MQLLEEKIKNLPHECRQEVEKFVDFILETHLKKQRISPKFYWAGAMKELQNKYTSVELQHKILELRLDFK